MRRDSQDDVTEKEYIIPVHQFYMYDVDIFLVRFIEKPFFTMCLVTCRLRKYLMSTFSIWKDVNVVKIKTLARAVQLEALLYKTRGSGFDFR
jgi:hypothetical protein